VNFILKIFLGNTYKFVMKKNCKKLLPFFFCKIFYIKHFSQQILQEILTNFIIL